MSVTTEVPSQALIGGRWVDGSGGTFEVRSPHSREVVNVVSRCDASDVDRAVAAARAAQPEWAAMPLIDRVKILRRINQIFVERAEPIARMVSLEIGKTITDAREEVYEYAAPSYEKAGAEVLRHRGLSFPSTQEQTNNKRLVMTHRPLGVVGAITPYNFPTDISSIALAHIIAAGNTAVWKPSEFSPTCCAMVAELFDEAGLPPGVVNVVQGFGDVGAAIVDHDDVDGIFFTGSTATGEKIGSSAPLKPQLLELGGDGPFIILADADIDAAVEGAMNGCFYYTGQVCTSAAAAAGEASRPLAPPSRAGARRPWWLLHHDTGRAKRPAPPTLPDADYRYGPIAVRRRRRPRPRPRPLRQRRAVKARSTTSMGELPFEPFSIVSRVFCISAAN